jgi:glycerol-3-phosphate dehydrogenase
MAQNRSLSSFLRKNVMLLVVALFTLACKPQGENVEPQVRDDIVALVSEKEIISPQSRDELLQKLKDDRFDVLIIGGGATGAGAALDAASRGLKAALVEAQDFSSGTSSRSTKLVHGGVRYLENAIKHVDWKEYQLVRDALHERKNFLDNAPHLTNPLPILTPVYSWFEAAYYLIGLKLYDFVASDASLGHSQFMSREKTLERFPTIQEKGLKGSVIYYDGQFDDARMNVTLILSAIRQGAVAANYVRVEALMKEDGVVRGAMVIDEVTKESWPIHARVVINATGTYADSVRMMDDVNAAKLLEPSQGSHILLPAQFSSADHGLIIPKTKDGRVLFLLPWMGKTVAGTTDQAHENTTLPKATNEEVDYIIEHLRNYLSVPLSRSDVLATWSGLRPLSKPNTSVATAAISRDHVIEVSKGNLITIVGGKWTTYRKMAEDVIDQAIKTANLLPLNQSLTKNLKLVGARFFKESLSEELVAYEDLPLDIAMHLANSYGDRVDTLIDVEGKARRGRLVEGYPYIEAEVLYAVTHEYAVHATDILARRMRLAFLDNRASREALAKVVALMAYQLGWNDEKIREELHDGEKFLDTMLTTP